MPSALPDAQAKSLTRPKSSTLAVSRWPAAFAQDDICGLHVAVHEATRGCLCERARDLEQHVHRASRRQWTRALDHALQANCLFVSRLCPEGSEPPELGSDAVAALKAHSWPGNVRELRNVVERAMAYTPIPQRLGAEHLRIAAR